MTFWMAMPLTVTRVASVLAAQVAEGLCSGRFDRLSLPRLHYAGLIKVLNVVCSAYIARLGTYTSTAQIVPSIGVLPKVCTLQLTTVTPEHLNSCSAQHPSHATQSVHPQHL